MGTMVRTLLHILLAPACFLIAIEYSYVETIPLTRAQLLIPHKLLLRIFHAHYTSVRVRDNGRTRAHERRPRSEVGTYALESLLGSQRGSDGKVDGGDFGVAVAEDLGEGLEAQLPRLVRRHEDHGNGAIVQAAGIARGDRPVLVKRRLERLCQRERH